MEDHIMSAGGLKQGGGIVVPDHCQDKKLRVASDDSADDNAKKTIALLQSSDQDPPVSVVSRSSSSSIGTPTPPSSPSNKIVALSTSSSDYGSSIPSELEQQDKFALVEMNKNYATDFPNSSTNATDFPDSSNNAASRRARRAMENLRTWSNLADLVAPTTAPSDGVRRSMRQRKSTTITVNGYNVLHANNYVLKGASYEYSDVDNQQQQQKKKRRKSQSSINNTEKPSKKARTSTALDESQRLARAEAVRAAKTAKAPKRLVYLARHLEVLRPFCEASVLSSLSLGLHEKSPATANHSNSTSTNELHQKPDMIRADLRDYQLAGLNWMVQMHNSNLAMILGDEMGLGKTLQTISLLCYLKETEHRVGPSLVVCPLSVLYSWAQELEKWAPGLKYLRFHASSINERKAQRMQLQQDFDSYDVVITTYEMIKAPSLLNFWRRQHFGYLILDEGHVIKNKETQLAEAMRKLHFENALILTGTPLQNDLVELYSLLNFLYPDVFTTPKPFADAFCLGKLKIDKEKLEQAHDLLNLFMLRRLKETVEKLMPKKIETKVICPLSQTQIFWYKGLLLKDIDTLVNASQATSDQQTSGTTYKKLSNLMMQLRKCCDHPFLFEGAEVDPEQTTCQDLVAASGKLSVLDMLLRSLSEKGHRVVLFSQFTRVLDILSDYCEMRRWKYSRFDGGTLRGRRNFLVKQFNAPNSDCFLFLMSTRSGGLGLNLQTADTVVLFDSDFNPQPDLQAMARVHRLGQEKTVHVYRMVSGGTIEERIVDRAQKKLYLDQMVNRGTAVAGKDDENGGLTASEILSTLRFGCNAIFGQADDGRNALPTPEEIELITDRKRTEDFSMGNLKGGLKESARDFDAAQELSSTSEFGGVDFKAIRDARAKRYNSVQGLAEDWAGQIRDKKRQSKSRIVMLQSENSGYGAAAVPVLASNIYDLEAGESSVFDRELKGKAPVATGKEKSQPQFEHQDFCQICGDGGSLLCCSFCPVCVHVECFGPGKEAKGHFSCPHHRCSNCQRTWTDAGGILFPCQSCPLSFCDDCLPDDHHRMLGECERFEKLGFDSTRKFSYIHCSPKCESLAKVEFGWSPKSREAHLCPPALDVSYAFGKRIDDVDKADPA